MAFQIFSDSGLTTAVTAALEVTSSPVKFQLWLGNPVSGKKIEANSDPGVDDIILDIVDANPGTGNPDTDIKLATTESGLTSAVAGASLTVGTQVLSGVANAFEFWVQVTDSLGGAGLNLDLSVDTNELVETSV